MSVSATGNAHATVTIAALREPTTFQWQVLGPIPPTNGNCSQVNFYGAPVKDQGTAAASNGIFTVATGWLAVPGCYSLTGRLAATATSPSVVLAPGVPVSTTMYGGDRAPQYIGESTLSLTTGPSGLLQETREVYPANAEARNVAITSNLIDYSIWRVFEVRAGVYRLINKATGNALQSTAETNSVGGVNVVTTPASWNISYQEWQIRRIGTGSEATIALYNVADGRQLGSTGETYSSAGTFVTQANTTGRWASSISELFPTGALR